MRCLRLPAFAPAALLLGAVCGQQPVIAQSARAGFFAGLQGSYQRYPGLSAFRNATSPAAPAVYPAAFSLGYGFGPATSVELTYTRLWTAPQRYTSGGYLTEYRRRASFGALILRKQVALPAGSTSPWALEVLGGMGPLEIEQEELTYNQSGSQPILSGSSGQGINDFLALAGLGVTYRLAPHWQLTAEVQAQLSGLRLVFSSLGFGSESNALGGGVSAGVRYWLRGQPGAGAVSQRTILH